MTVATCSGAYHVVVWLNVDRAAALLLRFARAASVDRVVLSAPALTGLVGKGETMPEVQLSMLAAEVRAAIDNEDLDSAAHTCLRVLTRYPRWVDGYWLLGSILVERDHPDKARSCFEAVASAMPDDPRPYEGLAAVAQHQGDLSSVAAGLFRAIEVGETSQGVQNAWLGMCRRLGRPEEPVRTDALLAHMFLVAGRYQEAERSAEKALGEEPDRLDLLLVQAMARLFAGNRDGARSSCERIMALSPDCLKALAVSRYLLLEDRDLAGRAGELGDSLAALDPEGRTLIWLRGQLSGRGFDVGGLPSEPRLVCWGEETNGVTSTRMARSASASAQPAPLAPAEVVAAGERPPETQSERPVTGTPALNTPAPEPAQAVDGEADLPAGQSDLLPTPLPSVASETGQPVRAPQQPPGSTGGATGLMARIAALPGVKAAAVIHPDGRIEVSSRDGPPDSVFAAVSAAMFGPVASALGQGGIASVDACLLEAGQSVVQMKAVGGFVLMVIAAGQMNNGLVRLALKHAADTIARA